MQHNGKVFVGLNVVAEALRVEDFPMTREDIDYAVGDVEVKDSVGKFVPVRRVLDIMEQTEFGSAEEVVRAIRDHVDRVKHKHTHTAA